MPRYSISLRYQYADSLLGILISTAIGSLLCACALQHLLTIIAAYNKLQQRFQEKHELLVARHFIGQDLYRHASGATSCKAYAGLCLELTGTAIEGLIKQQQIKPYSDLLILYSTNGKVIYYLRKSVLAAAEGYALYRDNLTHNSQAIAENVKDLRINIAANLPGIYTVAIHLQFKHKTLDLTCIF